MGFLGINRLTCQDEGEGAGWRVFAMGTNDVCTEESLFEVLF